MRPQRDTGTPPRTRSCSAHGLAHEDARVGRDARAREGPRGLERLLVESSALSIRVGHVLTRALHAVEGDLRRVRVPAAELSARAVRKPRHRVAIEKLDLGPRTD